MPASFYIQPGRRLVEEERPRPASKRERNRQPPGLTTAQSTDLPVRKPIQFEHSQQVGCRVWVREMGPDEVDNFDDSQLRGHPHRLRRHPDQSSRRRDSGICPEESSDARVRSPQAEQDIERGCFPSAVGAQKGYQFSFGDGEAERVERLDPSEALRDVFKGRQIAQGYGSASLAVRAAASVLVLLAIANRLYVACAAIAAMMLPVRSTTPANAVPVNRCTATPFSPCDS